MKNATVAELRNEFPKIARWLEAGESVRITRRGLHIADLRPVGRAAAEQRPEFSARLADLYADGPVPDSAAILEEDREERR